MPTNASTAIPREARAWIWIKDQHLPQAQQIIDELRTTLKEEYKSTDPNLQIHFQPHQHPNTAIAPDQQRAFLNAIYACPNGIYRLSPDVDDLVQTSNNLAKVWIGNGTFRAENLTRSAVDSEKIDQANAIRACFELAGATVEYSGSYPGMPSSAKSTKSSSATNLTSWPVTPDWNAVSSKKPTPRSK